MAWKAIPGFLLKDFWFPFGKTHVVKPVAVPSKDCENLCAATKDCCRWGVREVKEWGDAKDAKKGFTHLGWEIHGADVANFEEAIWCMGELCAEGGAVKFAVTVKDEKVLFHLKDKKEKEFPVAEFPGKDGEKFYVLVILSKDGWTLFDKDGKLAGVVAEEDALENLKEAPKIHAEVTFVKSYSCGLFEKKAPAAKIRFEALQSGILKKCEHHGHESVIDADKAFAAALEKAKGEKWSVNASAGSQGISFASIVCAVFSSVALVFLVLFVAKKNSHLEVAVDDE